jgi:putative FmdB family regulatory protein
MPLYEYECFLCGERFERIQRVSDEPVRECPSCGGAVRRLLGVPALQFKGSGFYITDYGRGNGANAKAAGETAAESSSSTDAPAKKDSGQDSTAKKESKTSTSKS